MMNIDSWRCGVPGTLLIVALAGCNAGSAGGGGTPSVADTTPPAAVTALTATATGASGVVTLTWVASVSADAASYNVAWVPPDGPSQPLSVTPGTATGTTVTGLTNGTLYTFTVTTVDQSANLSTTAPTATATPSGTPPDTTPPSNVTALAGATSGFAGQVTLTWTASVSTDVASYQVTWAPAGGEAQPKIVTPATAVGTTVTGLTNGTSYTFTVAAVDTSGNVSTSPPTVTVTPTGAVTDVTPPSDVTSLAAAATGVTGEIRLTWVASTSADATSYTVTWAPVAGEAQPKSVTPATATGTNITGLTDGVTYTFTVKAVDTSGNVSVGAAPVTASPGTATILVDAVPSGGVYPVPPQIMFNFNAAGTVTYSVDGTDPTNVGPLVWTAGTAPITVGALPATPYVRVKYRLVTATGTSTIKTDIYEIFPVGVGVNPRFVKFSGMRRPREGHTVVRLLTATTNKDDVAVIGGIDRNTFALTDDGERFNSNFEHFENAANVMGAVAGAPPARAWHAAAALPNGRVLVAGGQTGAITNFLGYNFFSPTAATATAVLYDGEPTSGTYNNFVAAGGPLGTARFYHTATRLFNDQVLFTGGQSGAVVLGPLASTSATPSKSSVSLPVATVLNGVVSKGDLVEVTAGAAAGQVSTLTNFTDGNAATGATEDTLTVEGFSTDISGGDTIRVVSGRGVNTAERFSGAGAPLGAVANTMNLRRFGHTATLLDDGNVLVAGGTNDFDNITISDLMPDIYDHSTDRFRRAGVGDSARLITNRFFHSATKLKDGKVLIAGGTDRGDSIFNSAGLKGTILSSAEVYDPVTETTATVGSMTSPRFGHSATVLEDGRVVISGGIIAITTTGGAVIGQTADVYDPVARTFSSMTANDYRAFNTSVTLSDGRALIMGGAAAASGVASDLAEFFLPSTNQFTAAAHGVAGERTYGGAATVLSDGKTILVTGGQTDVRMGQTKLNAGTVLASAELYSLATIKSSFANNSMSVGRRFHSSTLLLDTTTAGSTKGTWHGKVLIAGGENETGGIALCDLFDPATGRFTSTGAMAQARWNHTATLLPNGKILVAGGGTTSSPLASAELYDPSAGNWINTGNTMTKARTKHTAVLIPNKPSVAAAVRGKVLIVGGNDIFDTSAELFDPASGSNGSFSALAGTTVVGRRGHSAALRSFSAGFAKFTNASGGVQGFQSRWNDATIAAHLRPAAGDVIASLSDGTLYQIASVNADPDGAGPEDAAITLTAAFTGATTVGYQPYVVLKDDVFLAGGEVLSNRTDTFGGAGAAFVETAAMAEGRHSVTVVATPDGNILVAGGIGADIATGTVDSQSNGRLYTPAAALGVLSGAFTALFNFDANGIYSYHYDARAANGDVILFRSHSAQAMFQQ